MEHGILFNLKKFSLTMFSVKQEKINEKLQCDLVKQEAGFFFKLKFLLKMEINDTNFHCELVRKHNREKKAFSAGLVQPLTADFAWFSDPMVS